MKKFLTILFVLMATTLHFTSLGHAEDKFSKGQTEQIETLIKDYINNNPKIILDSLESYRSEEAQRAEQSAKDIAKELSVKLKGDNEFPYAGNKDGDIVVIEFFDYNCGYCKKALDGVNEIIEKDKDVKIVFIELPILGEQSVTASRWAIAAQEQGKYFEFHRLIMDHRGSKSERELSRLAESLDLDIEKLKEDAMSDKTDKIIENNKKLAQTLGVSGTPAFVIEDRVVRGFIPYEAMQEIIKEFRNIDSDSKEKS